MPWIDARTIPYTRLGVVSQVPSDGGVFAIMDGESCLLVGESWNLKARLLELINVVSGEQELTVTWECCDDHEREPRRLQLSADLIPADDRDSTSNRPLPGIQLRDFMLQRRIA
jgi:hypothetical protein